MARVQFRRDSQTNWNTYNPILADGEIGIEKDTQRFKLGDGLTTWNNLVYSSNRLTDDYFAYIDKEDITSISYNENGMVSSSVYQNGCVVNYTYNANDLLLEMVYTDVDGSTNVAKKIFNYDASNQLTSVSKVIL